MLDSPYKGLVPYTEEDARFFFGREAEREIIIANLMASRLTLLYGPSGVGKSSVLYAGVAHHLHQATQRNLAQYGTPEFAVIVFNDWRDKPVAQLEERIYESLALLPAQEAGQVQFPDAPSHHLPEFLQAWTKRINGDLLIILDQFEEYFLYHAQEDGEETFAAQFSRAITRSDLRANFLISIREDALAKLDRFEGRIPNLFDNYLRIEHLDREAARAATEKPIAQFNRLHTADGQQISVEPDLIDAVLDQVQLNQVTVGEVGRGMVRSSANQTSTEDRIEAPYLQLVMTRLWKEETESGSSVLRLETLNRLGGADRIVRTHLDSEMKTLPPSEQDTAYHVFHYLVTPGGTKIAYTVSDLAEYAKFEPKQIEPLLEELSRPEIRILRSIPPPPGQSTARYEIFHDVLAAAILDWRTRYVQEQEQAKNEKQLARWRKRLRQLVWTGLCLFLALVAFLAPYVWRETEARRIEAEEARQERGQRARVEAADELPNKAHELARTQPDVALLLSLEAIHFGRNSKGWTSLLDDLSSMSRLPDSSFSGLARDLEASPTTVVALSPDGKILASASINNGIRSGIWLPDSL